MNGSLVDASGAVAAVDVAAVGHVELGLGRRGPLVAAVAVDPEEGHGVDLSVCRINHFKKYL